MSFPSFRRAAGAGTLLLAAMLGASTAASAGSLLVPFKGENPPTVAKATETLKQRVVQLDLAASARVAVTGPQTAAESAATAGLGETIQLDLLPGVSVSFSRLGARPALGGGSIWTGLNKAAEAEAALVLRNGRLTGSVYLKGRLFDIRPIRTTRAHLVRELKVGALRSAEVTEPVKAAKRIGGGGSGAEISVLIAYTDTAYLKNPDIVSLANLAITNANRVFTRSGVSTKFKLVGTMWAENYDEANDVEQNPGSEDACPSGYVKDKITPFEYVTNLHHLRLGCGYLDHVQKARDSLRADLVVLIVNRGNTEGEPVCGYAYGPGIDEDFITGPVEADHAVSVATAGCLTYPTLSALTAFNMGITKDRYVTSSDLRDNYSFGYVDPIGRFRDLMSEDARCAAAGVKCRFVEMFSNPKKTVNGRPFGVASGPYAADAVRAINENASTVASFR